MASLREQFEYFYTPDEEAVATALRTGLVTPDTNVLLSLYRFQSEARDELFGALEKIGDRLWIPYQVAFEFHRKRLSVIAGQESYFSKTKDELDSAISTYLSKLRAFFSRIALSQPDAHRLESMIKQDHAAVLAQVSNSEKANEVHLDNRDSDDVLARLEVLFTNRVGEPMKPEELEATRKESERRVKAKIPPGYMDRDKPDPSGDYIIFKQFMREANIRKLPTVFITDDRKEDWYRREHGLTLGARYELREEMLAEAKVSLHIMTTETFLLQAEKHLKVSVSPETVSQAKEIPESMERDEAAKSRRLNEHRLDLLLSQLGEMERLLSTAVAYEHEAEDAFNASTEENRAEARKNFQTAQRQVEAARAKESQIYAQINSVKKALINLTGSQTSGLDTFRLDYDTLS